MQATSSAAALPFATRPRIAASDLIMFASLRKISAAALPLAASTFKFFANSARAFARIVVSVWLLFSAHSAQGQGCCTSGTSSLGGFERGIADLRQLHAGITYHYNDISNAYEGSTRTSDPLGRSASVEMLGIDIEYGLADGVSLLAQIGYFNKKRSIVVRGPLTNDEERVSFNGFGVGDLTMLGKYQLVEPSLLSPWQVSIGRGAKLPVGRYQQAVNGSTLSLDLQAGSGAIDLISWAHVAFQKPSSGITI